MKLPLRIGLPLLGLLLVGLAFTDGPAQQLVLFAAMGVALWTAFSLPRPGPPPEAPLLRPGPAEPGAEDGPTTQAQETPSNELPDGPRPQPPGPNGRNER